MHKLRRSITRWTLAAWGGVLLPLTMLADPALPRAHWAFQPVRTIEPPTVRAASCVQTPVDRFILARLESAGLEPSPPATREQLIRRVSIDLIGLPPTPEEVDSFMKDRSPSAYPRLIDRLLASPRYGERWARHWLDLARYAESDGFEHDAARPHSWRYRDYVIRAFNEDKPFDRFVREQLAGDELWPDDPAALIATGFHLLGPDMVDSADQVQRRFNTLNDMTDTTASVFLGITFGCARCHDHKFEPFTQRDYFAMQAFFAPVQFQYEHPIPEPGERLAHERALAAYNTRTRVQRLEIEALELPYQQRLLKEKLSKLSTDAQLAHRTPKERRTMEQEGTVQETAPQVKVTDAEITRALSGPDKARRAVLEAALKTIPKPPPAPLARVLQDTNGPAPKTFVLARGDYNNPREEAPPGFPAALGRDPKGRAPGQIDLENHLLATLGTKRRAALAEWIAAADNPLTARVMVNRIWQHHFGRGLVASPSDFGTRGQAPTHPELLDWLAGEFVRSGWSVKRMHQLILRSTAYQLSSSASPEALARDPENRLCSHQRRARLDGEVIRDSLLAISGHLNSQLNGPSVPLPIPVGIADTPQAGTASVGNPEDQRRSIYLFARRNLRFPFLEVFDAPDSNLTCPERGRSTTAPQSLTLLNSAEVLRASRATAERLKTEAKATDERIELAFRLVLGRPPNGKERTMALEFLEASRKQGTTPIPADLPHQKSAGEGTQLPAAAPGDEWTELCRALFNLNAFVYAD